jgi:hypothetical protein
MPASSSWQSVTYGDDKFAAVGGGSQDPNVAYSTDGITWTQTTMPSPTGWQSVTYGDNKFVAVARYTTIAAYSTDGITWTASTMPASVRWQSVTYGDGKFVAVSGGGNGESDIAAYSTDGITWTQSTLPSVGTWNSVTHGIVGLLTPNVQYTSPASKQAIISSIFIANNSSSSQTYSVAVVPSGETLSSIHYIRKNVTINANDFGIVETKITLSEGDQIMTVSSSTDVVINIFGVEK